MPELHENPDQAPQQRERRGRDEEEGESRTVTTNNGGGATTESTEYVSVHQTTGENFDHGITRSDVRGEDDSDGDTTELLNEATRLYLWARDEQDRSREKLIPLPTADTEHDGTTRK